MEKISRLTKGVMASNKLGGAAEAALVCHLVGGVINGIFSKEILESVKIVSFKNGSIYFSAKDPCAIQEVKIREQDIINQTNKSLKEDLVKKVRFKTTSN